MTPVLNPVATFFAPPIVDDAPKSPVHTAVPVLGSAAHELTYPVLRMAVFGIVAPGAASITLSPARNRSESSLAYGMYRLTVVPLISTPGAFAVVEVGGETADAYPPRQKKAAAAPQITAIARFMKLVS